MTKLRSRVLLLFAMSVGLPLAMFQSIACAFSVSRPPVPDEVTQQSPTSHRYVIRIAVSQPILAVYIDGRLSDTYPVALGKVETQTPIGHWHVVDKQVEWGNGFGSRWIGLDVPWGTYGIHGTNRPASIGQYTSNGCIRMNNRDVERLYAIVPVGTPVVITGNPLAHLRRLTHGHIGADVQMVQQRLQQLGYFRGICNGQFAISTQYALILFQLAHRLPMDGAVDVDDYRALGLTR